MFRKLLLMVLLGTAAGSLRAADLDTTLKGVEDRYNRLQSLQMNFTYTYKLKGRSRTEKGTVYLRKPDRIRFQYSSPAGKLWIADGKYVYSYIPDENTAEKINQKDIDDLRTPLAFLLGNLHFHNDFQKFVMTADGRITAYPKSDKLTFTEVSFLVAPDFSIQQVSVTGQDGSVMDYVFDGEKKNPPVADSLFKFTPPPGVEFVDSSKGQ